MIASRRIFWMLANAFMALFCSFLIPLASVVFVLLTTICITANCLALTVEGRVK